MRLYVPHGGSGRSVALSVEDDSATVGELCEALGLDPARGLLVDGHHIDSDVHVVDAPFVDGSTVSSPNSSGEVGGSDRWWVGVTAGPDTGALHRVSEPEVVRIGRNPESQLVIDNDSVSGEHAELRWTEDGSEVTDLGSRNGIWVEDGPVAGSAQLAATQTMRLGSSHVQVRAFDTKDRPLGSTPEHANDAGRILINRPPRLPIPSEPTPLKLPDPLEDRANPKLSIPSLIVPIIFATVMVLVIGRWQFALFALLSPVMVIGNYVSAKRTVKDERKTDASTRVAALANLEDDLREGIEQERVRRGHLGPDMVELRRRVEVPSNRLWERRSSGEDALIVRLGRGQVTWSPPLADKSPGLDVIADDVREIVDRFGTVEDIELVTDLRLGVLGIHGDDAAARALARALALQVAVNHGPADVRIAVLTSEDRIGEWSWLEWLPHAGSEQGDAPLVLHGDNARRLADGLLEQLPDQSSLSKKKNFVPRWLLLVDDVALVHERASSVRRILEHVDLGVHGVVLADRVDQLPASTTQVVAVDSVDGQFSLGAVDNPTAEGTGLIDAVSVKTATDIARAMARFEDPEVDLVGGGLPEAVTIRDILCEPVAESVLSRWSISAKDNSLGAPLGIGSEGPLVIDMTIDGPHGLVAGTTGAGKSELLRTMVIGLASEHSPDDLVFVLVDYKGGSAFDVCTTLPHVVGIVTDLDEHLSQRALRSLDAELHHRELVLRDAEAKDIFEYRDLGSPAGPLPRLMVVIDEFATLRAELPDFVSALVGIAQRGRSLGVHMILATQRPSGAVDANIKANTNLRIALRVQDGADSSDVIDVTKAAELPRTLPGRAYVRRGEGDLTLVQTGYASGPVRTEDGPRLRVAPLRGGAPRSTASSNDATATTNLAEYVEACVEAGGRYEAPRRPWLDPLPERVDADLAATLDALAAPEGSRVDLAVGDDPDHQRWIRMGWDPSLGHLGVIGALGSGVTTTIRSAIIALGRADLGRDVWVYAADHAAQGLVGIDEFAHVAPVIDADDEQRHDRLRSLLDGWVEERSQMPRDKVEAQPLIVVAVDGIAGFAARMDLGGGSANDVAFAKIVRDGPALGIVLAIGAANAKELPRSLRGSLRTMVVLEQLDSNEYMTLGFRLRDLPTFRPGLAMLGENKTVAQIIDWSSLVSPDELRQRSVPADISPLPADISVDDLGDAVVDSGLTIPIGIENATRTDATLRVRSGEHVTIVGPPQSGRTTALRAIAGKLRAADPSLKLVGVGAGDYEAFSPDVFDGAGPLEQLGGILRHAITDDSLRWVVCIDDADRVDDASGVLADLARTSQLHLTMVVAMRTSAARGGYGHWSRQVRSSGVGVLLQPDNTVDGDILGVRLPRGERLEARPGRAYLVQNGEFADIQLAH